MRLSQRDIKRKLLTVTQYNENTKEMEAHVQKKKTFRYAK